MTTKRAFMLGTKRTFMVVGEIMISVHTEVEARSPEEALKIAAERGMMSLCHGCSTGSPSEEWVTSGELGGETVNMKVEES
jgi:hypothetical protein